MAPTLFQNPLLRWGIALLDAIVIAAIAIVFIDDRTLRVLMFAVAAAGLVITPMILKRAAMEA